MGGGEAALVSGVLAAMGAFIAVWAREQRRTQAAADARLQRVLDASDRRADRDRESHERSTMALVESLRDHVAADERSFAALRERVSDVHDAVLGCPGRSNGAGPGHVREG